MYARLQLLFQLFSFIVVNPPKGYLRGLKMKIMTYFWHDRREVWPCNREVMSDIQDTTKLLCRDHFRSFNHSLLSLKCILKITLFLTSSFLFFCSKAAQGRQNFFPCYPYLIASATFACMENSGT